MNVLFYQFESAAAREKAQSLGIPYQGRNRIHMLHFEETPKEMGRVLDILEHIRNESDWFRGRVVAPLDPVG